jgi:hypothetical protein
MIETRVGLQAAMGGDRTKAATTTMSVEELGWHAAFVAAGPARSTALRCDVA